MAVFTTENFSAALSFAVQRPRQCVRLLAGDWESVDRARLMVDMLDLAEQIRVHHRLVAEHVGAGGSDGATARRSDGG